ncbi:hypothetical protein K402DRAFT_402078 [Aulographum hederae CBS 113979]|uniref:Uncharacterized protein n=1 Tax=Aulographum hederae CBS 113979 TaxID=1176131 RepID=A0A6G1H890_9PEZI|nr:hypothetical protein K402DRAFT_402078 [Aulographum hederae CBS 113979]
MPHQPLFSSRSTFQIHNRSLRRLKTALSSSSNPNNTANQTSSPIPTSAISTPPLSSASSASSEDSISTTSPLSHYRIPSSSRAASKSPSRGYRGSHVSSDDGGRSSSEVGSGLREEFYTPPLFPSTTSSSPSTTAPTNPTASSKAKLDDDDIFTPSSLFPTSFPSSSYNAKSRKRWQLSNYLVIRRRPSRLEQVHEEEKRVWGREMGVVLEPRVAPRVGLGGAVGGIWEVLEGRV